MSATSVGMSSWTRGDDDILAAVAPPAAFVEQPE